ncbi:MAG: 23S rRNA (uracil(1939)-C(5))-methyltransferase RlmD [Ardenticatenaceae bacterium]|nr:23S rRNA (uracil(1939)-C(5))-methyltransferase RlmD [Ardenticatenaceae bacterium]HBY99186.1 23S rRNA (uracil(1939)-C(5))-methyltransferase RlmD [Chloroflexota bacterium]
MNHELELTVEAMAYGGAALGRHEGRVIFVPYALPGERVRVRLTRQHKRWAEAELVAVVVPSPERVRARCPHFGSHKCGGCQWQHIDYRAQLRFKREIVADQLHRIGKFEAPSVRDCLGNLADPWMYRNNVQLHADDEGNLGFINADRNGVYPIDVCYIMNPAVYELFQQIEMERPDEQTGVADPDRTPDVSPQTGRIGLRGSVHTGDQMIIVEAEGDEVFTLQSDRLIGVALRVGGGDEMAATIAISGESWIEEELGGRRWHISAGSFFQVNSEMAEQLLAVVRDFASPPTGSERILDVYAGVGTFGLSLAPSAGLVWLVEAHPEAVADARINASGLQNVEILEGPGERILPAWPSDRARPDLAILDPPRAGCDPPVLQALIELQVPRIVYVSCDPATLARDLRRLADGGYHFDAVQPIDLFPQTFHIETVVRLQRG